MTMPDGPPWELMHSRDDEPSDQSPLVYRERTYFVPEGTSEAVAEAILAARFEEMREELASRAKGKLVNMALFDHRWEGRPERPPLMTLQWKDWRGEPKIGRPRPSQPAPAMSEPPAAAPKPAPAPAPASSASPSDELELSISDDVVDSKPPPRQRRGTDEALANAFEALQDLFFLTTPIEGLEFVVRLLTDLVPAEAYSACLYDINADELRFVALEGPGADAKKGLGVPRLTGLLGAAALSPDRALLVEDVASDGRYDAGSDGRDGVTPTTMALMAVSHQGRLLGMLQVINRTEQAQFSRADANLMAYVAEKLGEFLQAARMRPDEQRA